MAYQSGPVDIQQGNSANFVVEYFDVDGLLTVPSSGTLFLTYTNTSGSSALETISLTEDNSFFLGTWSSTSAALGLAIWSVTAPGITSPAGTGLIRVIEREGA